MIHFSLFIFQVVQYKVQSRLEEQRKKALDIQLNFIVDQTEKYSSWLAESLKNQPASNEGSTAPTSPVSTTKRGDDEEFEGTDESDESDVEETILEEEEMEQKVKIWHIVNYHDYTFLNGRLTVDY